MVSEIAAVAALYLNLSPGAAGVPLDIEQALLRHPEYPQLHLRVQSPRQAPEHEFDRHARSPPVHPDERPERGLEAEFIEQRRMQHVRERSNFFQTFFCQNAAFVQNGSRTLRIGHGTRKHHEIHR